MSDLGWIKLHRKLLEHPLFKDPQALTLWVQLLLRANHKDARIMVGNSFVDIKRGQFLTGRDKLSEYTGINRSKLERLLKLLESEQQIEQQKTTKYRIISIVNYDKYQDAEQQVSINRATSEQQVSTNKNDKNVKNDKKEIVKRTQFKKPELSEVKNYMLEKGADFSLANKEAERYFNYYEANGWKVGKNKMANWKSACTNWLNRIDDFKKEEKGKLLTNDTGWING